MKIYMKPNMKPLLRFLDFGCFSSPSSTPNKTVAGNTDVKMTTEKLEVNSRAIRMKRPLRQPPKPRPDAGNGGQIHAAA
uniref:Uncharacterized protein n=1 Tax=Chenopodium quinoa TaxID=63459 RepID=A0A803LMU4_CHEQI